MPLRIRYRSADDEVTERVISNYIPASPDAVHAFCHLRGEDRTFILSRIEEAFDESTGEIIPDVWVHFGLPSLKRPALTMPTFQECRVVLTQEEAKAWRNFDKRKLFAPFKLEVLARQKRLELNELFLNKCFKCGHPRDLELDHHVPQCLGGRLLPGNIVLLCSRCNSVKHERHPREFYSEQELSELAPILEAQLKLFDFSFNWTRWNANPKAYLMSLGIPEDDAENAIIGKSDTIGVRLTVTFTDNPLNEEQPNQTMEPTR